ICPARILFRETTSEWIRENFCKKIQQKAKKIANELYYKENAQKIELIMQTNPLSFYSRIVDELKKSKQEYVYLVSFCVLEKILTKIQTKRNYPPQRKNKLLTLFRRETKEKLAKNY
ncbi:MAG: hypothetical protein U9O98_03725, partial [Asgard group archaeon]|nr:hypothetical protein [Asgard group archaeon]